MYEARGIGGDNLIDRWDWQEELRQRHIAPIRGTQTSTAPTNAPAPICGRNIDSTVVAGTQNGVPIGPNTVTALNLAQNPNYNAAPTFQTAPHNQANSGAFDYIGSGSGAYDVYTNFVIAAPAGNLGIDPPWLDVLRFYKVPQGASFDPHVNPAAAIMDVNARGDGNYQLVRIPGNVAGQAYDIYMAFVDHSGLPSAAVLIGTTSANPIVIQPGNGAPVPSGFAWSAAASAITYSSGGAGTYDTTFNLSLTINNYGSGSPALSTWFYEVGVLVSIAGKNNFSEITVVPPPGGTVINGITAAGLGAGNAYDVKIRLHSFNSNSYTDSAVLFTTQTQYIGPGGALSGSGPNLVVDSNFIHVTGGNPANSTGSNDPYWTFYWIDGASFFIGAGGYQTATGMANYLGVRPGDSSRKCLAQSLPMPVSANQQYGYSGYIDASTCSGNQPLLEVVSTDGGTVYKSIAQTNGHSGIVQDTYTVPASGGPTQVCLRFNSNAATINSSILVFAIPQFQMGVPGPYQAGPDAPITPAPTSPPPTNSPTGDGGTSSGGGGADPTTQPGHYNHGVHSQQTQAVINATAGGDGSYFANSQLVGRHFKGGNTGDTSAMVDSSSNLLFTRHAAAVTGTLQSTLNGPSYLKSGVIGSPHLYTGTGTNQISHDTIPDGVTYARVKLSELASGTVKQLNDGTNTRTAANIAAAIASAVDSFGSGIIKGQIHRLHLEQTGQPGGTNLLYNPTFANGTTGWNRNIPGSSQVLSVSTDTFGGGRLNISGTLANGAYDGFYQSVALPFANQTMMISGILEAPAVSGVSYNVEVLDSTQGHLLGNFVFDNSQGSGRQPFAFRCDNGSYGTVVVRFYAHNSSGASVSVGTMTIYKLQLEYGKTPSPFVDHLATANHTKLFDGSAALLASTTMNTKVPNSTSFRHNTHIWVSFPVGSTSLTYYIDDGGGAGTAPTFWRPDGTSFTSAGIGVWNSKTGGVTVTGLTANANAYICAYYVPGDTTGVNGTGWHVTVQATPFGINSTPIAQAYADGGYIAVQASTGSSSTISSGTSGAVSTGGGGGGGRMTN